VIDSGVIESDEGVRHRFDHLTKAEGRTFGTMVRAINDAHPTGV
jgi:hypothetical protein